MSIGTLIIYLLCGKLSIYFLQNFPFALLPLVGKFFRQGKILEKLLSCDLCLGFWVYTVFAGLLGINIFAEWFYIPVLSEIFTGMVSSFIVHLVSIGWKDKFGQFVVE